MSNIARHIVRSAQLRLEGAAAFCRWRYGPVRRPRQNRFHNLHKPLIVSLTSYPPRFRTLPLTLKCLLSQSIRPDEVVLWIAHEDKGQLTRDIWSLQRKGLRIRFCEDLKSFNKIIPAIKDCPDTFLVTADDDIYYRRTWLEDLVSAWTGDPREVVCHRAHRICVDAAGLPLEYGEWEHGVRSPKPSPWIFPTGVGGVLYPPGIFHAWVTDESLFMNLCPTADDVWLYWMMRLNGGLAKTAAKRRRLVTWRGSQKVGLQHTNVARHGNDQAIQNMIARFGFPSVGGA